MPRKDIVTGSISAQAQQEQVSEGIENFELPKSLVTKIAKSAMPENTKLQREAQLSLVKSSTVFINYLAATAHDVAHSKQHKSISASDVLKALELVEFGDLVDGLQAELQIFRDNAKADKGRKSGGSSASAAKSISAKSAGAKSKGKGKEKTAPSTSISASTSASASMSTFALDRTVDSASARPAHPLSSVSMPADQDEDMLDGDRTEEEDLGEEGEGGESGAELEEEPEMEDDYMSDEAEDEEPVDMMAVEEEETRADARALALGAAPEGIPGND